MEIVNRLEPPLEWKLAQPHVWATLRCGVRIQELLPDLYGDVCELIRTQLAPRETMCMALNMAETDPDSVETMVDEALCCMRDGHSIVGVAEEEVEEDEPQEEAEGGVGEGKAAAPASAAAAAPAEESATQPHKTRERVVAAMVARVVQKRESMEIFSRVKLYQGEKYKTYAKLNNHMMRTCDLYSAFNIPSYYRIYHFVVHQDYKNRGVALFMGKLATLRLTALFKQKICAKLCPDRPTEQLLRRLGFTDYRRFGYEEWIVDGEQVFFYTGSGNYSLVLMTYEPGELKDVNEPLEEIDEEPEPGPPSQFPGRNRTGAITAANRPVYIKPFPPAKDGRVVDYRYLFHRNFEPSLQNQRARQAEKDKEAEKNKENLEKEKEPEK